MAAFDFPNSPSTNQTYTANGMTFIWNGSVWKKDASAGVKGAKGDAIKGDKGQKGEKGDKGNKGDKGDKGQKGEIGPEGGSGGVGDKGNQGDKGEKGDKGTQGDIVAATFNVTNNGASNYIIDGQNNPTLKLVRGFRYNFNVNVSGHPFWIKTSQSTGTGNGASGVTNNGAQTGTIVFEVPSNAPATLYYICQYHGSMVGTINVVDNGEKGNKGDKGQKGEDNSTKGQKGDIGADNSTKGQKGDDNSTKGQKGEPGQKGQTGSTAGTASQVIITGSNVDANYRPVFAINGYSSSGVVNTLQVDGNLGYNPGTNVFSAGTLSGSIQTGSISSGQSNGSLGIAQEGTGRFLIYRNTEAKDIIPLQDSQYDLGTDAVRWQDIYADNLHGDGSNITGLGGIRQVKSTTNNSSASYTVGGGSYVTVVNFNVSITCNSSSHKVLVLVDIGALGIDYSRAMGASLAVNGTRIGAGSFAAAVGYPFQTYYEQAVSFSYLHSPGTTAQQTYSVQINHSHGSSRTMYFNTSDSQSRVSASTITAMEVT